MALRVLELFRAQELEPELAADRVRGAVVDRRVRVEPAVLALGSSGVDREPRGLAGDPAALELGEDRPARLPDGRPVDVPLPVADRSDRLTALLVDDLEHPAGAGAADPLVLRLALDELLLALGAAEELGHGRVAE